MNAIKILALAISFSFGSMASAQDNTIAQSNEYTSITSVQLNHAEAGVNHIYRPTKTQKELSPLDSGKTTNLRTERAPGIRLGIGAPTMLPFISRNEFISPAVNIEFGVGILGIFTGARYHFGGNKENRLWTPYIGGVLGYGLILADGIDCEDCFYDSKFSPFAYVPVGVEFISRGGFNMNAEVGFNAGLSPNTIKYVVPSLSIGYRWRGSN